MAKRQRDYAAEYARRQELARQKGYRSYGQRRYVAEKRKRTAAVESKAWPKSTFKVAKRAELFKYTWYYRTTLKMPDGSTVYRTISVRRNRNLTRSQLRHVVEKEIRTRHKQGFASMGLGEPPEIVEMELENAYRA